MDARTERCQHRFAIPVVLAAVATIPVLVLEKEDLAAPLPTVVRVADWLIWGVFALEAVALLAMLGGGGGRGAGAGDRAG
jgi:hypothetical protein